MSFRGKGVCRTVRQTPMECLGWRRVQRAGDEAVFAVLHKSQALLRANRQKVLREVLIVRIAGVDRSRLTLADDRLRRIADEERPARDLVRHDDRFRPDLLLGRALGIAH